MSVPIPDLTFEVKPAERGGWWIVANRADNGRFFVQDYIPADYPERRILYDYQEDQAYQRAAKREEVYKLLFALKVRQRSLQGAQEALAALTDDFGRARHKVYAALLEPDRYRVAPDVNAIIERAFAPLVADKLTKIEIMGIPVQVDPSLPFGAWMLVAKSPRRYETWRSVMQDEWTPAGI